MSKLFAELLIMLERPT